jgi:4a-hydroxytetrahydrobiopterin dehydratase
MTTYQPAEISQRLKQSLPHWEYREGHLCRVYRTHGWKGTVMVINAVGHLAEAAWHHPDIAASYNKVEVRLQSHDAGGITERDFALAKKIEDVIGWQPGKEGGPFSGTPAEPRHAYIKYD